MRWPFVSRETELAHIGSLLDNRTSLAVLGPVGVGKTRLLDEAVSPLDGHGYRVLRFVATEATKAVPYAPFIDLLPAEADGHGLSPLRGVLRTLEERSKPQGVVLAVDDAQHLDDGSLALLSHVVNSRVATIAMTVRSDGPVDPGLAALLRAEQVEGVDLRPFDRSEFGRLLTAVLGETDPEVGHELWRLSQGNVLLLRELVEGSTGRTLVRDETRKWQIVGSLSNSPRLSVLIGERLFALDDTDRLAIEFAAIGAPLPILLLEELIGADVVERLEAGDLLTTITDGNGVMVRPGHPIFGEVMASNLPPARLRRLKSLLVQAASKMNMAPGLDPLRLAIWQHESGVVATPDIAIRGAALALGRQDARLAERLARSVADRSALASILLGRALSQQARYDEAEQVLSAIEPARLDGNEGELASARAQNLSFGLNRVGEAVQLLKEVAAQVDDLVMQGRLDAERGVISAIPGDFRETFRAARSVIENPDATGAAQASAYVSLTLAQAMTGDCAGLNATLAAGLQAARAAADDLPLAQDQILIMHLQSLMAEGRVTEAIELAEGRIENVSESGVMGGTWLCQLGHTYEMAGRLKAARQTLERASTTLHDFDPFQLRLQAAGSLALAAGELGDELPGMELAEIEIHHPQPRIGLFVARGVASSLALRGDLHAAAQMTAQSGEEGLGGQHTTLSVWTLHDSTRFGYPGRVVELLDEAVDHSKGAVLIEMVADVAHALVDEDGVKLLVLARRLAAAGAYLWAADASAQSATLHTHASRPVDAARAAFLSRCWESRCGAPSTPALRARPNPVTTREMEIGLEAGAGIASRDIALSRFISTRTVDNHLGSVYRKLGIGSREELRAFLAGVA